jgi:hypothetical protein
MMTSASREIEAWLDRAAVIPEDERRAEVERAREAIIEAALHATWGAFYDDGSGTELLYDWLSQVCYYYRAITKRWNIQTTKFDRVFGVK